MKRYRTPTPGSAEWMEWRRHNIGATDAAVVAGRSPFAGPWDKWAEMQGNTAPKIATEAMEAGIRLQKPVAEWWAEKHERKIRACPWTYELEPGIGSHYDYDLADEKAILEVKTAGVHAARDFGEENTAEVPEAYQLQVHHEMACRPLIQRAYLAVLVGGQRLKSYVVERDDGMIEDLLKIERMFLANSKAGIAPPMDGSNAAYEYLRGISPRDNGERWELPESVENLATAYLGALASVKSAEEAKASAGNLLRAAMGDNAAGIGKSVKVSYKSGKDSDWVDWRAVALSMKNIPKAAMDRYTSTRSGTRPLIVSLIGD
jgi:putative phage-type endonuclease